ncbi:MAG TPA: aldo/keto reductase [Methanobacterium sp.]|nr:aldo/keto reductase [Methanobacterium sp.]
MLYREMGQTGELVSILGFGCMRLPTDGRYEHIDRKNASELLDFALESGVNYLDTAYTYHGINLHEGGDSELFLGEYLQDKGNRDEILLSTKLPSWLMNEEEDFDKYLNLQLKRLKTDYIDFYLLHSIKESNWSTLEELGVLDFLDNALSDGRIRYTGFSTHENTELFKDVLETYKWDMCLIQYNYLDENIQVGREGLELASSRKMGVAVMEPLKGGVLADYTPDEVSNIWDKAPVKRSPAEWAFRYLWNHPEITTVLSGMNTMKQLVENIFTASDGEPHSLTAQELGLMDEVKKTYKDKIAVECSRCEYCMPCPNGVNIPQCFSYFNQASMLNDTQNIHTQYHFMLKDEEKADNCLGCGVCEEICTQKIPIREKMKQVKQEFR